MQRKPGLVDTPLRRAGMMDRSLGMHDSKGHASKSNDNGAFHKANTRETGQSRHLWVGNLSPSISEVILKQKFGKFGALENVTFYPHRSYAFVNFKSQSDAADAKRSLQGTLIGGLPMRIEFAKGAKPSRLLLVSGISHSVTQGQLEEELKSFGNFQDLKFFPHNNSASVNYVKLDDAISAFHGLNGKKLGNEWIQVDFGQSENYKKDEVFESRNLVGEADFRRAFELHHSMPEPVRGSQDNFGGSKRSSAGSWMSHSVQADSGFVTSAGSQRKKDGEPSDVLWIGFPVDARVEEHDLQRAFIPYGEIERITTFPGRSYAFIQFRSVMEAVTAKNALTGKLFNDPRFRINFSKSEIGPVDNGNANHMSPFLHSGVRIPETLFEGRGFNFPRVSIPNGENLSSGAQLWPFNASVSPRGGYPNIFGVGNIGEGRSWGLGRGVGAGSNLRMNADERLTQFDRQNPTYSSTLRAASPKGNATEQAKLDDTWDLPEEDFLPRDFKRARIGVTVQGGNFPQFSQTLDNSRPYFGLTDVGAVENISRSLSLKNAKPLFIHNNLETPTSGSDLLMPLSSGFTDHSRPLLAVNPGSPIHSSTLLSENVGGLSDTFSSEHRLGVGDEGCNWEGTIAKGGTFICRAKCFPIDRGFDINLPEVINCTARTDLDMLGKHIFQVVDYGTLFFVPQGDTHVAPYQDFLHYLQEKHRAGVAKLGDGSSLFLVPSSEFSEKILKLSGRSCIFGVVLKSQQAGNTRIDPPHTQTLQQQPGALQIGSQVTPQPPVQPPLYPQHVKSHLLQASSEAHAAQTYGSVEGIGAALPESSKDDQKSTVSFEGQSSLQTSVISTIVAQLLTTQPPNITLTPELIASLAALLPQISSSSGLNVSVVAGHTQAPNDATSSGNNAGGGIAAHAMQTTTAGPMLLSSSGVSGSEVKLVSQPVFGGNSQLPSVWPPILQDRPTDIRGSVISQTVGAPISLPSNSSLQPQTIAQQQPVPVQRTVCSAGPQSSQFVFVGEGQNSHRSQGITISQASGHQQPIFSPLPPSSLVADSLTQLSGLLVQNQLQLPRSPPSYDQHLPRPNTLPQPHYQLQSQHHLSSPGPPQTPQNPQVPPKDTGLHRVDFAQQHAPSVSQGQTATNQNQGTDAQDVSRVRFQATLHLAQALLQQMQQQEAKATGSTELR